MTGPTLRRATSEDAEELTRLRILMGTSLGWAEPDEDWTKTCVEHFRTRLAEDSDFVAVVVDQQPGAGPGGALASSGCGWIDQHLPGFADVTGRVGYVASMSTDVDARGKGLGRAVFDGLLAWFDEKGILHIELHASTYGESLYRSYGFDDPRSRALSLWRGAT